MLEETSRAFIYGMGALRFIAVSLLAFFLLGPLIKSITREVEKPVIVLAQDNSESLLIGKDSTFYQGEYLQQLQRLKEELSDRYEVQTYTYGDVVQTGLDVQFDEKRTNISELLREVHTRYSNRNLGALIIAGDGIFNTGANPVYSSKKLKVPVFTVAMGDTAVKRDLLINDIAHNRLAYLGNDFPLEVVVEARRLAGKQTLLRVSDRSGEVYSAPLSVDGEDFFQVIPIQLEAKNAGLQRFRVEVIPIDGEISTINNVMDIYIDVLDSRQKVLILANSPHPDVGAIKAAIESNSNYEVDLQLANDFDGEVEEYSLAIMHQLPSVKHPVNDVLSQLNTKKIPALYVLGSQTNYGAFNQLGLGLQLIGFRGQLTEVTPLMDESFSQFTLDEELQKAVTKYPPLHVPFGTFKPGQGLQPLFTQRVGMVKTELPLIAFHKKDDLKFGIISGEGIWRWRVFNYSQNKDHDQFNTLVGKMVQYLASKEDKSFFRVYSENSFLENQNITFEGELYNESYELVNEAEVGLKITNADGNEFDFNFSKTSNAYRLDAGQLPVGEYTYQAKVTRDGEELKESGEFSIAAIQMEASNSVADHQLLFNLANRNGGTMVYANEVEQLAQLIEGTEEIVPVSYTKTELADLLNLKWIFFLILGLLSLEWFLRKRNGAY